MRFTVRRRIVVGVTLIVSLGAVALFIVYLGLSALHTSIRKISDREGPTVAAAHEMEINLVELAAHVLRYLTTQDRQDLERIATDRRDFERFHAQYVSLSSTPRARALAQRVGSLYGDFVAVSNEMIATRDAASARFAAVMEKIEIIDEVLDAQFEDRVDRSAPGALQKVVDAIDLEADTAEVGLWLANFRHSRRQQDLDRLWDNIREFQRQSRRLRTNVDLNPREQRVVSRVEGMFVEVTRGIDEVLALDVEIVADRERFRQLLRELDDILDEEIQVLAVAALDEPTLDAEAALDAVVRRTGILLPLFLLSACAVAGVLITSVTRPIARLTDGTAAVQSGDLSARIPVKGSDELANLADQFNRMVAQLESTTVSKAALENSEAQLRITNRTLRREIADRCRAEDAERGLRQELHRHELLARLGSLVAGVAHEVRNPLFGISSTVDALEARLARLGPAFSHADHLAVLRRELTRLTLLTRDLLDYGKPVGIQRSPSCIENVLTPAVQACAPLADRSGVTVQTHVAPGLCPVSLDAARMVQVFQNLIENAIHHSPAGAVVGVTVTRVNGDDGDWVHCEIVDQGPGFDDADLPHVFQPFFTRRTHGTGLGLSIVDRIVDQHGGRAAARNGTAGGAVLTVQLPLSPQQ